ncbi:50S ribosomal protein L30e-like protein [Lipomyces japonicus]|uniref:40S ribosomal protein eS12 n=1 Tax=Lipomyces japonicus TaxID=56871 RepID=UPI0034CE8D42
MSDTEEVYVAEEVEVEASAPAPSGGLTVEEALKGVLRKALIHDGLARGLREASKALSRREAHLAVLVDSVDEESYVKLIEALCAEPGEKKIPLIKVSDPKKLGEWAGLCVLDREGNARKVVGASVVVVKDWGEQSVERDFLLQSFEN